MTRNVPEGDQVQAFADAGSRESERVGGLEQTTRSTQEAAHNLAHRQGAGATSPADHNGSESLVGNSMVPEGLTNRPVSNSGSGRYKVVAGAKGEKVPYFLGMGRTSAGESTHQRPGTSGVVDAHARATRLRKSAHDRSTFHCQQHGGRERSGCMAMTGPRV